MCGWGYLRPRCFVFNRKAWQCPHTLWDRDTCPSPSASDQILAHWKLLCRALMRTCSCLIDWGLWTLDTPETSCQKEQGTFPESHSSLMAWRAQQSWQFEGCIIFWPYVVFFLYIFCGWVFSRFRFCCCFIASGIGTLEYFLTLQCFFFFFFMKNKICFGQTCFKCKMQLFSKLRFRCAVLVLPEAWTHRTNCPLWKPESCSQKRVVKKQGGVRCYGPGCSNLGKEQENEIKTVLVTQEIILDNFQLNRKRNSENHFALMFIFKTPFQFSQMFLWLAVFCLFLRGGKLSIFQQIIFTTVQASYLFTHWQFSLFKNLSPQISPIEE